MNNDTVIRQIGVHIQSSSPLAKELNIILLFSTPLCCKQPYTYSGSGHGTGVTVQNMLCIGKA